MSKRRWMLLVRAIAYSNIRKISVGKTDSSLCGFTNANLPTYLLEI
ncbi:hypothetical protein [Nostoc sp.]